MLVSFVAVDGVVAELLGNSSQEAGPGALFSGIVAMHRKCAPSPVQVHSCYPPIRKGWKL